MGEYSLQNFICDLGLTFSGDRREGSFSAEILYDLPVSSRWTPEARVPRHIVPGYVHPTPMTRLDHGRS
jgi:hypothetical protein